MRVILLLVSFKYRNIVKFTIYFECIFYFLEALTPTSTELSKDADILMLGCILVFVMSYFKFLPSLLAVEVSMLAPYTSRYFFYGTDPWKLALACFLQLFNVAISFTCCHLIITKVGMIFVDAEVLREGNEQLLNNLDEGVIITD